MPDRGVREQKRRAGEGSVRRRRHNGSVRGKRKRERRRREEEKRRVEERDMRELGLGIDAVEWHNGVICPEGFRDFTSEMD